MASLEGVKVGDRLLLESCRLSRRIFTNAAKVTEATVTTECCRSFRVDTGVDREKRASRFELFWIARPVSAEEEAVIRGETRLKEARAAVRREVMDAVATTEDSDSDFWAHMRAALAEWKGKKNENA